MPYLACTRDLAAYAVPGSVRPLGGIHGLGDDGEDLFVGDDSGGGFDPSSVVEFNPAGAGLFEPVTEPVETGVTAPTDYVGPGVITPAQSSPGNYLIDNPTLPNTPASAQAIQNGAVGMNSAGQYVNAAGQAMTATGQIIAATSAYPRTLQPSSGLPAGAVGYNSAGQPVNAAGQVVSTSWLDQSTIIPGTPNSTVMLYGGGALAALLLVGGGGFAAGRR